MCSAGAAMVRVLVVSSIFFLCLCYLLLRSSDRRSLVAFAQTSMAVDAAETRIKRSGYVGDEACMPCHKEQALSYSHASHHLTSQLPSKTSILGSFNEGENILMIQNPPATDDDPRLFFKMDIQHGDYYQT